SPVSISGLSTPGSSAAARAPASHREAGSHVNPVMSDQALLPQLSAPLFIADGGLETTLVFLHGVDLPDFAAFPLLDDEDGREHLRGYYDPYLDIAERRGVG